MQRTVLIAEDDPFQREILEMMLKKLGCAVVAAVDGYEAVQLVATYRDGPIDAVMLDLEMPRMNGFEALSQIRRLRPQLPVIMLTAQDDPNVIVQAMKAGADDFILKPPNPAHLEVSLKSATRIASLSREVAALRRDRSGALMFADLIGCTGGLVEAVGLGRKAAACDVPVLLHGETGVGKELFARAIHGESQRQGAPFIAINCGGIPEQLVESILFGHEKGAFTGAVARSLGKFREAEGGTLFLDEIGELPLDAQAKLLRVLQEKEVDPVGAGRPVKVNVRIISASNRDLKAEVRAGRFRDDLYFRLGVLPMTIPALRQRQQDIIPLAEFFMQRLINSDRLPPKSLDAGAQDYLTHASWPGNVRELESVIYRALVLGEGEVVNRTLLQTIHDQDQPLSPVAGEQGAAPAGPVLALQHADGQWKTLAELEEDSMQAAMTRHAGNVTLAAAALGMAKSTFYRKWKAIRQAPLHQ